MKPSPMESTDSAHPRSFVRAAHYFSDGWPLDSLHILRMPYIRRELKQIRRSGFNTIILVVPWYGVQTSQVPVRYDEFHLSQLRLALREAERAGLKVLLRVAYAHQVMAGSSHGSIRQTQFLLTDEAVEAAWLDYFSVMDELAADYSSFLGMFVAWEELWHTFFFWQRLPLEGRQELARRSGFETFAQNRDEEGSHIPESTTLLYHRFVNTRIAELFAKARQRSSRLGVEYRVDKDLVGDGEQAAWLENEQFFDFEPQRYSYWAPFIGAENQGESLTAEAAIASLKHLLEESSRDGQYPGQVIEQFNFVDNTQQYLGKHAEISADQVGDFLASSAPLLAKYTGGYGLWSPRNYRCNILYNTAFLAAARGWEIDKGESKSGGGITLGRGGRAVQRMKPHISWVPKMYPFSELNLEISYRRRSLPMGVRLRVKLNGSDWVPLQRRRGILRAIVPIEFKTINGRGIHFEIENEGAPLTLTRVQLYHLVYRGDVRDEWNRPARYCRDIEGFNHSLQVLRGD